MRVSGDRVVFIGKNIAKRPRRLFSQAIAQRNLPSQCEMISFSGYRKRGAEMADQREFKIGVLAGDGIGPEITDATIEVLHAATDLTGLKLRLMHRLVGWKAREHEGALLS